MLWHMTKLLRQGLFLLGLLSKDALCCTIWALRICKLRFFNGRGLSIYICQRSTKVLHFSLLW